MMIRPPRWLHRATLGMAMGLVLSLGPTMAFAQATPPSVKPKAEVSRQDKQDAKNALRALSESFRDVVRKVLPSVVSIRSITKPEISSGHHRSAPEENPFKGTPFEDFFNRNEGGMRRFFENPHPGIQRGLGSGVIVDPSGVILTNNHVVEGASEVKVTLQDGSEYTATDIRTDPKSDLAVLRIKASEPLTAAKLGNSDQMEVGDWVLAIGNPFGFSLTVTAGIISGRTRNLSELQHTGVMYQNFLQTDAAINPGNSGGPLVNLDGEVIGLNTAISTRSGGYEGVGFAIPSNMARRIEESLVKYGTVRRAYLGVAIQEVTPRTAENLGVKHGVVVLEVYPDTPAAKAGLAVGDVIVKFNGTPVNTSAQLQSAVEVSPVGREAKLDIVREGHHKVLPVKLELQPAKFGLESPLASRHQPATHAEGPKPNNFPTLGIDVVDAGAAVGKYGYPEDTKGVVITDVAPNSPADVEGLSAGMLITHIGQQKVTSAEQFRHEVQKATAAGKGVLVRVQDRSGAARFIVIQPEKPARGDRDRSDHQEP